MICANIQLVKMRLLNHRYCSVHCFLCLVYILFISYCRFVDADWNFVELKRISLNFVKVLAYSFMMIIKVWFLLMIFTTIYSLGVQAATFESSSGDSYCAKAYRYKRKMWVKTSKGLNAAMRSAKPGDLIYVADGTYSGYNFEIIGKKGNVWNPITFCGTSKAVINAKGRVGLLIRKSKYVNIVGLAVTNASKGIRLETAERCTLDQVKVSKTETEGIHIQYRSHYNTVMNSTVTFTGRRKKAVGEGIYLGSSRRNTPGDTCIGNKIFYNKIGPGVTAEPIDVKEHSRDGIIRGNILDGRDLCGCPDAVSLINVKGNGYLVEGNIGKNARQDFYKTSTTVGGQGRNNHFRKNVCLGTVRRGFDCTRRPGGGLRGNKFE